MSRYLHVLPERFRKAELDQIDPEIFAMVVEYAANMRHRMEEGRGLLLSGLPGVGKTYALAALTKRYLRRAHNPSAVFTSAYDLLDRYAPVVERPEHHDSFRGQSWTRTYDTATWLVLNDLGKDYRGGKLAEQVTYKIGRLLRVRAEARLVTHVTTNLPMEKSYGVQTFQETYGDSIWSLTAEIMDRWEVTGPDRRERAG